MSPSEMDALRWRNRAEVLAHAADDLRSLLDRERAVTATLTREIAALNADNATDDGTAEAQEWADRPTADDEAIKAAFPTRSGRHDLYQEAQRLVHDRHGKFALVALVTWLLLRIETAASGERGRP